MLTSYPPEHQDYQYHIDHKTDQCIYNTDLNVANTTYD
jgi:hypothetical protein